MQRLLQSLDYVALKSAPERKKKTANEAMTIKVPFEILMNIQTNVNGIQTRRDKKNQKEALLV